MAELREEPGETHNTQRVRVLIVPAQDEAEHVVADILATGLDPARWEARVVGNETLASELITAVAEFHPEVIVLASLPPGGLAHCRYLANRVRAKYPDVRIIVGRWGCGEPEPPNSTDGVKGADSVDRSLGETRKRLSELHSVFASGITKQEKSGSKRVAVGTVGA